MNPSSELLERALLDCCVFLETHKVDYALIGGLAVAFYGKPRATFDVDFVVATQQASVDDLHRGIGPPRFLFDAEEIDLPKTKVLRALWPDSSDLAEPDLVVVDFLIMEDRLATAILGRRRQVEIGQSRIWICAPEDLVLLKVHAGRAKDLEDARGVIALQGDAIDRQRLLDSARQWGYTREIAALLGS